MISKSKKEMMASKLCCNVFAAVSRAETVRDINSPTRYADKAVEEFKKRF